MRGAGASSGRARRTGADGPQLARDTLIGAASAGLDKLRSQHWHDVIGFRVATEHRLREHEVTVDVHVKDPSGSRHNLNAADHVLPFLKQPCHQTGGVRLRASGSAVLDPHVMPSRHPTSLSVGVSLKVAEMASARETTTSTAPTAPPSYAPNTWGDRR